MVTCRSPKPFLRVRVLLPLPYKNQSILVDSFLFCVTLTLRVLAFFRWFHCRSAQSLSLPSVKPNQFRLASSATGSASANLPLPYKNQSILVDSFLFCVTLTLRVLAFFRWFHCRSAQFLSLPSVKPNPFLQ